MEFNVNDKGDIIDPWDYVVPEGQGALFVLMPYSAGPQHAGDRRQMWNPDNADEVEDAKRSFNDMKAKGYVAYRVKAGGEKGEQIHQFDPAAGKIIMAPALRGG